MVITKEVAIELLLAYNEILEQERAAWERAYRRPADPTTLQQNARAALVRWIAGIANDKPEGDRR